MNFTIFSRLAKIHYYPPLENPIDAHDLCLFKRARKLIEVVKKFADT